VLQKVIEKYFWEKVFLEKRYVRNIGVNAKFMLDVRLKKWKI